MNAQLPQASARVRLTVLAVIVATLFATLFARLWFLQVVNAPTAQAAVQTNGYKTIYTAAPRGEILSSDGVVLAGNRISQVITVDRQTAGADPAMEGRLAALLGMTVPQLTTAINNLQVSPYAPVPVLTDASAQQILYVKEHQALFPGVSATEETIREYSPQGVAAANIVGYTGQISQAQYKSLQAKGYQASDLIGEDGIEASFESVLRGRPGVERLAVDAKGDVLGVVSDTPPVSGDNVVLTINAADQTAAVTSLEAGITAARRVTDVYVSHIRYRAPAGAVVVENPNNGDVLALATDPDYNPNDFVGGISQSKYAAYTNPANYYPLTDRAIAGTYQPGSTYKLITATAGLQTGLITPGMIFNDNKGGLQVGNRFFKNDQGAAYGPVDLATAITVSDDAYFYNIGAQFYLQGKKYGPDGLQNVAKEYGFGSKTGIALPNEAAGLVPDAQVVKKEHQQYPKAYPNGTWYEGDAVQTAIGQEQDLVTPLQMDNAYATFANGGTVYTPQIASAITTPAGKPVTAFAPKAVRQVALSAADRAAMLAGFEGVTSNPKGTAYADFQGLPIAVAGKTGTAQVSNNSLIGTAAYKQTTSVFASFAPAQAPRFAVDCFMEQAGYGANSAGPVVRSIYNQLFHQQPGQPVLANNGGHD